MDITGAEAIDELLVQKLGIQQVEKIAMWGRISKENLEFLWKRSCSDERRVALNSLWVLTRLTTIESEWFKELQDSLIERLIPEEDTSKKRMMLQILKGDGNHVWSVNTDQLLEYCFSKINSLSEPYAARCNALYIAYAICEPHPELISELELYLEMLSVQPLSAGMRSALRQTRSRIIKLRRNSKKRKSLN